MNNSNTSVNDKVNDIVNDIIKLYWNDLHAIKAQGIMYTITQKELLEYSSFKFIEKCVRENKIDKDSMWLVKKELDDHTLLLHVYCLFCCWGITGCLDVDYHTFIM